MDGASVPGAQVGAVLAEIVAGTAATGQAFFESLVLCLSRALGTRYALVGELRGGETIRTVGLSSDGVLQPPLEYRLAGTPCADVVRGRLCYYPSRVAELFPDDALLREMGASSYLGVPLRSSTGVPIGILVVLHDAPIEPAVDPQVVLQIFAGRAAAEIERLRDERELERRAEQVRRSEETFAKVFRSSPAAMLVSELETGLIIDVNDAFLRMQSLTRDEVVGRPTVDVPLWDRPEDREAILEQLRRGPVRDLVLDMPGPSGRRLMLRLSVEVVDIGGRAYLVSMADNVTDRIQAELALKRSEERLRLALDAARMGAWDRDLVAQRVTWSDRENAVCGFPAGTAVPDLETYLEHLHPHDQPLLRQAVEDALSGAVDPYVLEHRVRQADGTFRWVESRGKVTRDSSGRPIRLTGTIADIDERKRTEEELRASETRLRRSEEMFSKVFRHSPAPMAIARLGGRGIVDVNEAMVEATGAARAEVVGRNAVELGFWTAAERDRLLALVLPEADRPARARNVPVEFDTPRGHRTMLVSVEIVTVEDEPHFLVMAQDITERLALEASLHRQETLAAMGSLVAGVAHEVRTPLFSISATLDAIEGGTAAEIEEGMQRLRAQVKRLGNLMSDLLDYGRPPELQLAEGRLHEVLERAVRACADLAAAAGVTVTVETEGDVPRLRRDARRLEQVFQNLVANAVQYSPRGGTVRLTVKPAADGGSVECRVADEGPGIPAEEMPRLFEPFFTKRKGGTGLGLPIVQRFVEAHGGRVFAANGRRGGAVFTVTLPAAAASEEGRRA